MYGQRLLSKTPLIPLVSAVKKRNTSSSEPRLVSPQTHLQSGRCGRISSPQTPDGQPLSQNAVIDATMARATKDVARAHEAGTELLFSAQQLTDEHTRNAHLSSLCFAIVDGRVGDQPDLEAEMLKS